MPQDTQIQPQKIQLPSVPGEDKFLDSLRNSPLKDEQRKQLWEVYHTPGDQKAFTGALNTLDMDSDTKKALYEMRWPQPSSATKSTGNVDTRPEVKGDARPSNKDVLQGFLNPRGISSGTSQIASPIDAMGMKPPAPTNPGYGMQDMTKVPINQFTGQYDQDQRRQRVPPTGLPPNVGDPNQYAPAQGDIVKALSAPGMLADPFSRKAPTTGSIELDAIKRLHEVGLLDVGIALGAEHPEAKGLASFATSMVKPESLAMLGAGGAIEAVPAAMRAGIGAIFTAQMTQGLIQKSPELAQAYKQKDWDKFTEIGSEMAPTAAMTLLSGLHTMREGLGAAADAATKRTLNRIVRKGFDPELNKKIQNSSLKDLLEKDSTPLGPISATGGQKTHTDFVDKAPIEAKAPVDTNGASKSANAPVVDRQALVAPNPADYVGKDTPVPSYRFPAGTLDRMAKGETQGLGKVDLSSKVAEVIAPNGSQTREVMAQTPSVSRGASKGADAVLPTELHADLEKQAGRKLTSQEAVALDRSNMERGMAGGIGKADESSAIREQKRAQLEKPDPTRYAPKTDPVALLHSNFHAIADLNRDADLAESEAQSKALTDKHDQLEAETMNKLRQLPLTKAHAEAFTEQAEKLEAKSKGIRDLTEATIKDRGVTKELAELTSTGGPFRTIVLPDGSRANIKPDAEIKGALRLEIQKMKGEVPRNSYVLKGMREGISPEEAVKEVAIDMQRKEELVKQFTNIVTQARDTGISIAQAAEQSGVGLHELQDELEDINKKHGELVDQEPWKKQVLPYERTTRDPGTGESKKTQLGSGIGRLKKLPVELDENGIPKSQGLLGSGWTTEKLKKVFGENTKLKLTDDEALFQEADHLLERGRLFRAASDVASEVAARNSQRGAIGEGKLKGEVKPVSLADRVPSDDEIMKRAKAAGQFTFKTGMDFPAGRVGLLSRDGGTWVDSGHISHDFLAELLLPEVSKNGSALRAMLDKGWIRKASPMDYEAWNLDSKALKTIETDLNRNGRYGQEVTLDTRNPQGAIKPLTLENGWGDDYKTLEDAVNATKRKKGWSADTGAIKGTTLLTSAGVGGVVGGLVGAHLGHPYEGVAMGWMVGFLTPAMRSLPIIDRAITSFQSMTSNLGMNMRDWMMGPKQDTSILRNMDSIRDAQQRGLRSSVIGLTTRLAQLPGDIRLRLRDKFVYLDDRPGPITNFLMKFDERGRAFRDLRGKLDVENSPYVSARLAMGVVGGMQNAHLEDYRNIVGDAQKQGVMEHLKDYLNLKGYQRVYDVLRERTQEADTKINQIQQGLAQPNLHFEDKANLTKALREAKADKQAVEDKVAQGNVVPQPYNPKMVQDDLQTLQTGLHPDKLKAVQEAANKVFALNKKVLDMIHDEGIIGDEDYQKYTARGDEYIPMHRILDQVSANTLKTDMSVYGKASPLYLRQQNVINALEGSSKVNVHPIVASADANLEAIREVVRNRVVKDFLKVASADPQGVGSLFKEVKSGYKARPDEGLVGVYHDGQQHTFATPSWLAESLKNVSPTTLAAISKPIRFFSDLLRKGATTQNLAWSIPNAMRHLADMGLMSDAGLVAKFLDNPANLPKDVKGLLKDYTSSIHDVITKDGSWQEYIRGGAQFSILQRQITPEQSLGLDSLGFSSKISGRKVLDSVANFNRAVEDVTKLTTFRNLRQAGYSVKNAAWETARYGGGPDFSQQGTWSPAINLASMFFTAHLAYVGRVLARAEEHPARVAVALGMVAAMGMTLNEWNHQQKDEDGVSQMRKVPVTDRENNFVVLTGFNHPDTGMPIYVNVPKGSLIKFLYNPMENMFNKMAGREDRSGTQLALQAIGNTIPGLLNMKEGQVAKSAGLGLFATLNPAIKTPVEEFANRSSQGTGGPIVPQSQQNIDPRYQFGPNTSEVAKRIGEGGLRGAVAGGVEGAAIGLLMAGEKGAAVGGALGGITGAVGLSPRRAEHIIDTTTAGIGRMATGFVDPFLGGVKQTRMDGAEKLANTPLLGPVAARFMGSGKVDQMEQTAVQNFYDGVQKAQMPFTTLRYLQKNQPDQVEGYMRAHEDELQLGQLAQTMQQKFGRVLEHEKQVQGNNSLSPEDKAEQLKNAKAVKMQILNVFNDLLRPTTGAVAAVPGQGQGNAR